MMLMWLFIVWLVAAALWELLLEHWEKAKDPYWMVNNQ